MLIQSVYDLKNPDYPVDISMLFLQLDKEIELVLGEDNIITGILRSISGLNSDRLVMLEIEVDDEVTEQYNPFLRS